MPTWISQDTDFQAYINAIPTGRPIAIDTEFEWTRTYFPRLALLQLATSEDNCALVDPFAITDWTPLRTLLTDPERPKIVFSGRNDLPILTRVCGGYANCCPSSVYDIQLAMGFAGHAANASLKDTIEKLFGIVMDKSETRSDWTRRPLSPQQLDYAADDVVLLPKAYQLLSEQLGASGNLPFFLEETELFSEPELYDTTAPADAWRRIGGYWRIRNPHHRDRIRALAQWREQTAQDNDLSRNRILPDEALRRLAQDDAITPAALMRLPRVHKPTIKRFQNDLLAIHANPPVAPEPPLPPNPLNTSAKKTAFNQLLARVQGLLRQRAQSRQIDPTLLGSRHDAEAVTLQAIQRQPLSGRLLQGWRATLLPPTLAEILQS